MLKVNKSMVMMNIEANDCHEVIMLLADALHQQGYVTEDYGSQTCIREELHPTGLPTKPFCIAFPHADCDGVIESALGVALLKEPVGFKNMADPDETLQVEIVIMLANANPAEQIQVLRNLALLFGDGEKLAGLRAQTTSEEVVSWLKCELNLE
jgi:PTS system galactitol-specific IIA component